MFDCERISHSNSSRDSNQPNVTFEDRWKWNNSPPTSDNEEQKKNCILKWPENWSRKSWFRRKERGEETFDRDGINANSRGEQTKWPIDTRSVKKRRWSEVLSVDVKGSRKIISANERINRNPLNLTCIYRGLCCCCSGLREKSSSFRTHFLLTTRIADEEKLLNSRIGLDPWRRCCHPCRNLSFAGNAIDWILHHSPPRIRPHSENHSDQIQ